MNLKLMAAFCAVLLIPAGIPIFAQDQPSSAPQQQQQQAFPPEQLDSLVAPIALYPDSLLSQVLVAATYPLELVEANQWLTQNVNLQGADRIQAAQQQQWDPSIQALVAFPDVVKRLTSDIRWTTDLGNAFLAQQADVMSAVQRMRARARDNGKLVDTPQARVVTENQDGQTAIEIQPTDPQVVYVPVYNPEYFWGAPYPYYPWPGLFYPGIGVGWGWGYGIHLGFFFGGCCGWGGWGWGPCWFNHTVIVNNYFFHRYNYREFGGGGFRGNAVWAHDPGHRLGVPYANGGVAQRFQGGNVRGGNFVRPSNLRNGVGEGGGIQRGGERSTGNPGGRSFAGEAQRGETPRGQSLRSEPGTNNHSAFGGTENGNRARVQSDHGFSSMGPARTAPAFHGGGGAGGGAPRASGGGSHGGGRR